MKVVVYGGLAVTTLLVACAVAPQPMSVFWRTGANSTKVASDNTACQVSSLRQVPRAMATGQTPIYTTPTYVNPSYTNCYGSGYSASCTTTGGGVSGGQTYGGQLYNYDANATLRSQVQNQCMANKGYQLVVLQTCNTEQSALGITPINSRPLPDASKILCATGQGYVLKPSI
jgi:hypothetical protein